MRNNHALVLSPFWRGAGLLLATLLPALAWAPAAFAQTITEYPIPTSNAQPHLITVGPDGNMWFTEYNTNKIAKITTAGVITECAALASGTNPATIVTGPNNNLWFTEHGANQLVEMNTSCTILSTHTVPTANSQPGDMTVGPDNNLWFVEENTSKIGQFVIGSGFKEFPTTTASADPFHIVSGPDGNLWFVENAVGKIGYITTAGSLGPEYSIPSGANSGPRSINVGSDNNLWFTEEGSTVNKIGQIVIANLPAMTEFTSPTSVTPWGIRSEPDDALWFTDYTTSAIARITTAGIFTGFYPTPTINSEPRSVIVGPDNAIWFTEQNGNNIGRISPSIVFTAAHDFNGDNMSDILWENSGNVALWLMNGKSTLQTGSLGTVSGWSIIGQQAFKGVTAAAGPQSQTADILWRDTAGDLAIWFMNGLTVSSTAGLGNVPTHWNVYGTADLNGNGNGDILWYDNGTGGSGTVAVWFMNSSGTVQSTASLGTVPPSSGWTILGDSGVGCGGVGCGGGIFWQDSAGDLAVWKLTGGQVTGSSGLGTVSPSSGWVVQGVGNFEGSSNGGTDILWYNTASGAVAIWTISNGQVQSTASVATVPPSSGWKIAQIGDYNGDGMSDILWIDGSGDVAVWFMNGPTIASTAGYGSVGTSWQVQNLNANN